jgi:hypothetical protein
VANTTKALLAWLAIPLRELEPCIPSHGVLRRQKESWFTRLDLPPRPQHSSCYLERLPDEAEASISVAYIRHVC